MSDLRRELVEAALTWVALDDERAKRRADYRRERRDDDGHVGKYPCSKRVGADSWDGAGVSASCPERYGVAVSRYCDNCKVANVDYWAYRSMAAKAGNAKAKLRKLARSANVTDGRCNRCGAKATEE